MVQYTRRPDGKLALTSSADNTARLWDLQTGKELRRFTGHKGLFGIPGIGGFFIRDPKRVFPVRTGGTGTDSQSLSHPREMPERGLRVIKEKFDAEVWPEYAPPPKKLIIEKAAKVDALATLLSDKIDAEVYDAAPKLKIVAQWLLDSTTSTLQKLPKEESA
jgi:hypothetical protein